MNKKLVALAVAGAFALPVAAQAQTANVTLYGRVNMDMELVSGQQANGSNPNVFRVSANSSRFGIRGSESLGGGLNAIFQMESSVSWDAGGGTIAGRESFVGLQGGWGTFKMGNFLVPYDDIHPIFMNTPQYGSSILSSAALWGANSGNAGGGTLNCQNGGFDCRMPNSVRYDSPNLAGFSGSVQYGTWEGSPVQNSGLLSAAVFYNNGPLQIGTAYSMNEDARASGLDDWAWTAAATYNFGVVRPAVVYETLKYETPTGDLKRDMWGVSVHVPIGGAGVLYGFFGQTSDGKGGAADNRLSNGALNPAAPRIGGLTKGSDTGAQEWVVTYGYNLSKRTNVYVGYVKINNECNASYSFHINPYTIGRTGTTTSPGCYGKPQGWVLGTVHNF